MAINIGIVIVYALLLGGIYYETLTYMVARWDGDYSYCYLVPPIVLYLLWENRKEVMRKPAAVGPWGLIPFFLGVAFFWFGEFGGEYLSLFLSFWLVLVGLLWVHLGREKIKAVWFPLVLIPTMFPPPSFLHNKLTVYLQLAASKLGVDMIHLAGITAYRDGNIIDLGFTRLQVVEACSGLRYLFPLIILGLLLAYFFKAKLWKRSLLVVSAIPLAIFTNSMRIALTGIISELWSTEAAEGFFHGFSGWFIFMFSLAVLLLEMWVLGKMPDGRDEQAGKDEVSPKKTTVSSSPAGRNTGKVWGFGALITILILTGTLVFARMHEYREQVPALQSMRYFPMEIDGWKGTRQPLESDVLKELDLTDYVWADYRNDKSRDVNFYMAYYASQRKGESIHSPETCLPGGGWLFKQAGTVKLTPPRPDMAPLVVNRAVMQKLDYRQVVYYWFPQRGRNLTNAYQLKFFTFWDALTINRTDGALVRLITPVYSDESAKDSEERLLRFTWEVQPLLGEYIPGRAIDK